MDHRPPSPERGARRGLPATVVLLGVVSLLTDVSSEMIFPLLPAFLAARVAHAPVVLGVMEGLADLVSAALKTWAGAWSDRARRRKPLIVGGYALSGVARPLMAFVSVWWHPLLVRTMDRVGKGVRSAPRDAVIAAASPPSAYARAFGFHRGMDHAGAALGAAVASGLVAWGLPVERVFLWAALPGAVAVAVLLTLREPAGAAPAFAPEPAVAVTPVTAPSTHSPRTTVSPATVSPSTASPLPPGLRAFLVPVTVFSIGNATDAFLLLRLSDLGAPAALLPLAWLLLNAVKSVAAYPGGALADRFGALRTVQAGWALYALTYVGLAFVSSVSALLGVMAVYGLYHALTEGAEKALVASLAREEGRGLAFGLYHALTGVGSLGGGLLFGLLWSFGTPALAFGVAGGLAAVAVGLLAVGSARRGPKPLA